MTLMPNFTYAEVGATRERPLPPRYNHLVYRTAVGSGPGELAVAADALLTFRLHRTARVTIKAEAARAEAGEKVTVGLGPVQAPCRIVYAYQEPTRAGWAYGTLPGHPERGEEAFTLALDAEGVVRFTVIAFSRPASWVTVAAGPLAVFGQRQYARWLGYVLRRIVAASRTVDG
jgi:uncharacterized protein (UPF0548 family)